MPRILRERGVDLAKRERVRLQLPEVGTASPASRRPDRQQGRQTPRVLLEQLDAQQGFAARERSRKGEYRGHLASWIERSRRGCAEEYRRRPVRPVGYVRNGYMNQTLASEKPPLATIVAVAGSAVAASRHTRDGQPPHHVPGRLAGLLEDIVLALLAILAIPVAILLVGMPVALLVRALIWITATP